MNKTIHLTVQSIQLQDPDHNNFKFEAHAERGLSSDPKKFTSTHLYL